MAERSMPNPTPGPAGAGGSSSADPAVTKGLSARPQARPLARPVAVAAPEPPGATSNAPPQAAVPPTAPNTPTSPPTHPMAPAARALAEVLSVLHDEPMVGMALLDARGELIACNRRFSALTDHPPRPEGEAPSSSPPAPPPAPAPAQEAAQPTTRRGKGRPGKTVGVWTSEGPPAVRKAMEERRPVLVRFMHEGRQVQCDAWPLPAGEHGEAMCLVLVSEGSAAPMDPPRTQADAPDFAIIDPPMAELGPLSSLTGRELEVLALVGQGMATREVAAALGRSPRTIERHCDSIHKKLGTTNRVQMARFALQAGLTPESARHQRV